MRVVKVVPTFLDRDFSVPATSTLRPAHAQKRIRETAEQYANKRRRQQQSVGALERDALDSARDQPVLSTEHRRGSSRGHSARPGSRTTSRSLTEASVVLINSTQTGRSEYAPTVKEESPELGSPPPLRPAKHLRPSLSRETSITRRSLSKTPSRGLAGTVQAVADSQPGPEAHGTDGGANEGMPDGGFHVNETADVEQEHIPEPRTQQLQPTSAQRLHTPPPAVAKRRNVYDVPSSPEFLSNDTKKAKKTYKRYGPDAEPEIDLLNTTRRRIPAKAALSPIARPGSLKKPTDAQRLLFGAKSAVRTETVLDSRSESPSAGSVRAATDGVKPALQRSQSDKSGRARSRKTSTPASTVNTRRGRPRTAAPKPATLRLRDPRTTCKPNRPPGSLAVHSSSIANAPSRTRTPAISVSPAESFMRQFSKTTEDAQMATNVRSGKSSSNDAEEDNGNDEPQAEAVPDKSGVGHEIRTPNGHQAGSISDIQPDTANIETAVSSHPDIGMTTKRPHEDESNDASPNTQVSTSGLQIVPERSGNPPQSRAGDDATAAMPWNIESWGFGVLQMPNGDTESTQLDSTLKLPSTTTLYGSEHPAGATALPPEAISRSRSASAAVSARSSPIVLRQPARFLSQSPTTGKPPSEDGSREPSFAHSKSVSPRPASNGPASDSGSSSSSEESSAENEVHNNRTQSRATNAEQEAHRSTASYHITSSPPTFDNVPASTDSLPATSQPIFSQYVRKTPIPLPSNVSQNPRASQAASVRTAERRSGARHTGFPTLSELLVDAQTPVNAGRKKAYDPRMASLTKLATKRKESPAKDVLVGEDETSEDESSSDSDSE